MKTHAIIPIFIPHKGCPNDCVFCNQKVITARTKPVTSEDVENIIQTYLSTLKRPQIQTIEIAFFGGSFTGIPIEDQNKYLSIAYKYKKEKIIDKIHLSTRPDYISKEILENLKKYSVDVIELGVQSFDEEVLRLSKRGHSVEAVYKACELIKQYGFTLGIQLMIGLPGDTMLKSIESAKKAASLKPELARIYPTVILEDTELAYMYEHDQYLGLSEQDAVTICKEMYKILYNADINIMRVGLKSTDLITNDSDLGKNYHPAFRQIVEGKIAKESILNQIDSYLSNNKLPNTITILSNPKSFSNIIGHKGVNKQYFLKEFPNITFKYIANSNIKIGKYKVVF